MKFLKGLRGFSNRLAYALALSLLVFNLYVLPVGVVDCKAATLSLEAMNLPVSAVGLLLDCSERGLDSPLGECNHQGGQGPAELFVNQLRLAVPVYLFLAYLPALFTWVRRRRSARPTE